MKVARLLFDRTHNSLGRITLKNRHASLRSPGYFSGQQSFVGQWNNTRAHPPVTTSNHQCLGMFFHTSHTIKNSGKKNKLEGVYSNAIEQGSSSAIDSSLSHENLLQSLGIANRKIRAEGSSSTARATKTKRRRRPGLNLHDPRQFLPPNSVTVRVKSVHAATTIDTVRVLSKVFGVSSSNPPVRHIFGKTGIFVQLAQPNNYQSLMEGGEDLVHPSQYVAVFRFGSVVFFNLSPREVNRLLEEIKKHSTKAVSAGFERKENFEVVVQRDLDEAYVVNGDFCIVQDLDMNSVAVISRIMGQTVALDTYNDMTDELLANFSSINTTVTDGKGFAELQKDTLFAQIAQNNSIFIDMISKLGIKDRSDTAWNLSQYERVYEGMREEFEIDSRFENIEFKLNLIQANAKFFLEMLNHNKTNTLEWVIIVLISFECVLMILEMSGTGAAVFEALPLLNMFMPK